VLYLIQVKDTSNNKILGGYKMKKQELIDYLETNYDFSYNNESKKELEGVLESYIEIECDYNEDIIVDIMNYILQDYDIINYNY
jgi:hypothetical protein